MRVFDKIFLQRILAQFQVMKISEVSSHFPYYASGLVVKGFGRGSKELGIPTANFPESVVENLPAAITTGIYYGWAQVDDGPVHKMVMSIGWNPYYDNKKKSMETHIINDFGCDFYNSRLSVIITGYIRGEKNFNSLDELIAEIRNDISVATKELDNEEMARHKADDFFKKPTTDSNSGGTSSLSTDKPPRLNGNL